MNNKVTINPVYVLNWDFKHIFSYKLMVHILSHYNTNIKAIIIDKQDIKLRYNSNSYSINSALKELIDKDIILPCEDYKDKYKINNKFFTYFK